MDHNHQILILHLWTAESLFLKKSYVYKMNLFLSMTNVDKDQDQDPDTTFQIWIHESGSGSDFMNFGSKDPDP